jgi:hypothetical protein
MEGEVGLEPTTSTVQSGVFYQLNYSPMLKSGSGESNPASPVWKTGVREPSDGDPQEKREQYGCQGSNLAPLLATSDDDAARST